jgi:DNA polymerase III gamma/tau subunit
MLTKPAFNALLKTMEEPPAHVKFILCTTDPQEVPATIQSRCQRFDFRPIPTARIAEQLEGILREEGVKADPAAVQLVARQGNGSMRDALSLLDRLLATGESSISIALAEQMLGVPDQSLLSAVVDAVAAREPAQALAAGDDLLSRGISVEQALDMLAEYLRSVLLMTACGPESPLIEMSDEARAQLAAQAEGLEPSTAAYLIAVCDAASRHSRSSTAARALYDAALVRMALHHQLADLPALLRGGEQAAMLTTGSSVDRKKKERDSCVTESASARSTPAGRSPNAVEPKPVASPRKTSAPSPPIQTETAPAGDGWQTAVARADGRVRQRLDQFICVGEEDGRFELAPATNDPIQARFIATQAERVAELLGRLLDRPCRVSMVEPPGGLSTGQGRSAGQASANKGADGDEEPDDSPGSVSAASAAEVNEAQAMPLVRKAMELFEARVMQVSRIEGGDQPADGSNATSEDSQEI